MVVSGFDCASVGQDNAQQAEEYAAPFVPEPDGRGTWSLLYSCIFTLALCVWTAFHPNVKTPEASTTGKYIVKIKWVVFSIFAPEIGVLTAFKQYRQAKVLAAELSGLEVDWMKQKTGNAEVSTIDDASSHLDHLEESVKDEVLTTQPFSQTYGFYILMGGLTVNVSHLHDQSDRVLITPSGLIHLAKKGYFFHVSDADIEDKSKANMLAKGLVLLQITWTILQCLSRKATGLPLSVLEVHILVHAGCALIMYVLWFNKPMDVDEPVDVSSQIPHKLVALMLVRSHRFGVQPYGNLEVPVEYTPVQLNGTKSGVWPNRRMSEAAYLMYNPDMGSSSHNTSTRDSAMPEHANNPESTESTFNLPGSDSSASPEPGQTEESNRVKQESTKQGGHDKLSPAKLPASDPKRIKQLRKMRNKRPGKARLETVMFPPRRGAIYTSTAAASTNPAVEPDHICLGFKAEPAPSIKTVATIATGQFHPNGIGPRAFVAGHWRGDQFPNRNPPFRPPTSVLQLPEDFRKRIPLSRLDTSTIVFHFPLTISLSKNDFRRWQLAGMALREELDARVIQPPVDNTFIDFENEADTIEGSYFVPSSLLINAGQSIFEELFHSSWGAPSGTHRHTLVLRAFYHHLLDFEEFGIGATTAVMMLPGLLYGGLHLALWFHDFPTDIEKLLWRISAVTLISVPVVAGTLLLGRATYQQFLQARAGRSIDAKETKDPCQKQETTDLEEARRQGSSVSENPEDPPLHFCQRMLFDLVIIFLVVTTVLYTFSRIYIIVESFISLRRVPVGVYTDIGW
ncbi:MAG: hypothetical protein Q9215_004899, partial [Flavoplaca cf. flavocitrina]